MAFLVKALTRARHLRSASGRLFRGKRRRDADASWLHAAAGEQSDPSQAMAEFEDPSDVELRQIQEMAQAQLQQEEDLQLHSAEQQTQTH